MGIGSIARIALAAAAVLALAWPSAAVAKGGTISGKLRGDGAWASAPAEHIVTVRAVRAETGETAGSERLTGSLSYRLKVPPGFYMVVAEVAGEALEDHSHLVKLKKGQKKRANLSLKPAGDRTAARGAFRARRPPARLGIRSRRRTNRVIAVSPDIRVQGTGLPGGTPIADMLIGDIVAAKCPPESNTDLTVVVHRKSKDWQFLQDEIRLQNSGAVDPSTRVKPNFIRPKVEVVGGGQMSNGTVSMQVSAVDIKSGAVVASASVSGPDASFFELVDELAQKLVDELCGDESALFEISSLSGTYTSNVQETETFFSGTCTIESNMQWETSYVGGGGPYELVVYNRDQQGRPIYAFNNTAPPGIPVNLIGNGASKRSCSNPDPGPNGSSVCDLHVSRPGLVSLSANPDESTATTTKMHWIYSYPQYSYDQASRFGGSCVFSGPRPPPPSHHVSGGLFVSPSNDPETDGYTNPAGITDAPTATFEGDSLSFTFSGGGSANFADDDSQGSSSAQWSMTVSFTRR